MRKNKKIFFLLLVIVFLLQANFAFALEIMYPSVPGAFTPQEIEEKLAAGEISENEALSLNFKYFFNLSLIVVTFICIAVSIYGGALYLLSGGSAVTMTTARGWIFSGILGLAILFTSYLILATINPQLVIFKIPGITESSSGPPPSPPSPGVKQITYQEIPIGTLVENILAKNIDCYDYDDQGDMVDADPQSPGINKMKNHDRLDCLKKLAEAVRTKSEKLKDLAEELEQLINNCECSNCSCACACPGVVVTPCSGDPCPDRQRINELRDEIKELVTGEGAGDEFLSIWEGIERLKAAKALLEEDLNYLVEAENLMKWDCQYETILNLVKFFDFKERKEVINIYIEKEKFENFDMKKYCIEFNCTEFENEDDPKKKVCTKYELNQEGRLCKATTIITATATTTTEYYVFDGDPATFYCLLEEILAQEPSAQEPEEKCVIDPEIENGFERGKIPIGELVDYAEAYANKAISYVNDMIENAQDAADAAYKEATTEDLYDLPPEFKCSNCQAICHCSWFLFVCLGCTCECTGICGPFDKVAARVNEIQDAYDKIEDANTYLANLIEAEGEITDEEGNEIDIPDQLNRWKLLNAFTNSRNKLEKCITGYGKVLKPDMTRMTLLDCEIALDKITIDELIILPGFEALAPTSSELCYPYNSEYFLSDDEKQTCEENKDSPECEEAIEDLMQNFFCCEGT